MPPKKLKPDLNEAYRILPHEEELLEKTKEKTMSSFAILLVYYPKFPELN